jgi:hypothetical protein
MLKYVKNSQLIFGHLRNYQELATTTLVEGCVGKFGSHYPTII